MNIQDPKHPVWQPIDFELCPYDSMQTKARVDAIRSGIEESLTITPNVSFYMGPMVSGRSMAEHVAENYRVLLRRIDELEADLNDLLEKDYGN